MNFRARSTLCHVPSISTRCILLAVALFALAGCRGSDGKSARARTSSPVSQAQSTGSTAAQPATGFYGDTLTLIRLPDGTLHGSFGEERGEQPVFSCGFLLQSLGPLSPAGEMPIVTWWPHRELNGLDEDEVTRGTLFLHAGTVSLQIPEQAHGGCWNVEPELDQGDVFEIGTAVAHPEWQSLRVVSSDKLEFHHRPDANDFTKAYIVRGDTVALLDTAPTDGVWHHVQLVGSSGPRGTGWVLDSGLMPWSVPTH